jgi:hypothetical protein
MFASIEKVKELIVGKTPVIVAGDEALLRSLPAGPWIGGTIPYFMTPEGGQVSRAQAFVTEVPAFALGVQVATYDEQTISRIGVDSPENGYTILVVPAFSRLHRQFALEAPSFEHLFLKVVAGWIAGTHLDDVGKITPKVFAGPTGEILDAKGVAMHIELPREYQARIGIVNIFEQGDGDEIQFPATGFEASECAVDGRRHSVAAYFGRAGFDTRLPLVANYSGTRCNVSIRSLDIPGNKVTFFAPVFEGVRYRHAKPVGDYAQRFLAAIPQDIGEAVFCCNCVHNYVYGDLEGRRTGTLQGPMTFGEIAYQLLNQTLVHVTLSKRR